MPPCRQHLAVAEQKALADQKEAQERFRSWARSRVPDAEFMNVGSGPQIRQLLFAGVANANSGPDKKEDFLELERVFKASRPLCYRKPPLLQRLGACVWPESQDRQCHGGVCGGSWCLVGQGATQPSGHCLAVNCRPWVISSWIRLSSPEV